MQHNIIQQTTSPKPNNTTGYPHAIQQGITEHATPCNSTHHQPVNRKQHNTTCHTHTMQYTTWTPTTWHAPHRQCNTIQVVVIMRSVTTVWVLITIDCWYITVQYNTILRRHNNFESKTSVRLLTHERHPYLTLELWVSVMSYRRKMTARYWECTVLSK